VSKEALSFTGTVFRNTSGIGQQLPPVDQDQGEAKFKVSQPKSTKIKGLLIVPVPTLYDQEKFTLMTDMLESRVAEGFRMHPAEGEKLGLTSAEMVKVKLDDLDFEIKIKFDSRVPKGVILAPRHQVKGLRTPAGAEISELN
jgi:anaerobic selenocysteine-containing dehydrogenase